MGTFNMFEIRSKHGESFSPNFEGCFGDDVHSPVQSGPSSMWESPSSATSPDAFLCDHMEKKPAEERAF